MSSQDALDNQVVCLENFSASYDGRKALNDLTLRFEARSTYAILGPSGCGKTTLLYAIAGLLPDHCVTEGSCSSRNDLHISTVLQDLGLFPWKTVLQNAVLPFQLKGKITEDNMAKAGEILRYLKLDSHESKYPAMLSGGQKQRVAIARSWLTTPELLLLDEPFSSLDAITRESLQDDVLKLYFSSPLSIIIVTHSIEEAVYIGQKIIILSEHGEMLASLDNETFGIDNAREQKSFYDKCIEIRMLMKQVHA